MKRKYFPALALLIVFFISGCTKQPAITAVPNPMTMEYLLKHMKTTYDSSQTVRTVFPPPIYASSKLCGNNAKSSLIVSAQQGLSADNEGNVTKNTEFLLLFTIESHQWNNFEYAIDSDGDHHRLFPYTSYIRQGNYFENYYLQADRAWIERCTREDTSLLLIGKTCEILIDIDHLYPAALLHYLNSDAFTLQINSNNEQTN